MSTNVQPRTIVAGALATAVVGIASYCLYFDYKRRNDPAFRRKLQREHTRLERAAKAQQARQRDASKQELVRLLRDIGNDAPAPGNVEEMEAHFLEQVSQGEQLVARGPEAYVAAAVHFFSALRVYPSPHELLMIYQKTQPPAVFELVMTCLALDRETGGNTGNRAGAASRMSSADGPIIEEIDETASPAASAPTTPRKQGGGGGGKKASVSSATSSQHSGSGSGSGTGNGNGNSFVEVNRSDASTPPPPGATSA